jgi:hypothetical protein
LSATFRGSQPIVLAVLWLGGSAIAPAQEKGAEPDRLTFPTFGIWVEPPGAPYTREPETNLFEAVRWVRKDAAGKRAEAIIAIQVEPARGRDLPEYAKKVARVLRARVSGESKDLFGERTIEFVPDGARPQDGPAPLPSAWAAQHNKNFYLLYISAARPQDADRDAVRRVQQGWRWRAVDAPDNHLKLADRPVELFGELSFRPAKLMRPLAAEDPAQKVGFAIHDFANDRGAYIVYFDRLPTPKRPALKEVAERFARDIEKRMGLKEKLTWADVEGKLGAVISSPFLRESREKDGRVGTVQGRLVLVPVDEDTTVLVTITSYVLDGDQNERMQRLTTQLLATLKKSAK